MNWNASELLSNMSINESVIGGGVNSTMAMPLFSRVLNLYAIPAVCVIGILGNAANLFTLASPRLKAVSYLYLKALAIADLLCMVFVIVYCVSDWLKQLEWPFTTRYWFAFYQAHLMLTIINWAIGSGVLVVVMLTFERFCCCALPVYFHRYNSRRRARFVVVGCYALSTLLYVPYGLGRHRVDEKPPGHFTSTDSVVFTEHWWKIYEWSREILVRFLPIVVLAFLNTGIMLSVLKRRRFRERSISRVAEAIRRTQNMPLVFDVVSTDATVECNNHQQRPAAAPNDKQRQENNVIEQNGASRVSITATTLKQIRRRSNNADNVRSTIRRRDGVSGSGGKDDTLLILLFCIVVMYFVCNLPAAVNLLLISDKMKLQGDYQNFRACANLLETMNHATNFYVFCLCSSDYRATLLQKFPCLRHVYGEYSAVASLVMKSMELWQMRPPVRRPSLNPDDDGNEDKTAPAVTMTPGRFRRSQNRDRGNALTRSLIRRRPQMSRRCRPPSRRRRLRFSADDESPPPSWHETHRRRPRDAMVDDVTPPPTVLDEIPVVDDNGADVKMTYVTEAVMEHNEQFRAPTTVFAVLC